MILAIMIPLRKNCATIEQNSAHIVVMGELSMKYAINTLLLKTRKIKLNSKSRDCRIL